MERKGCHFCSNAHVDGYLNHDTDFFSATMGHADKGFQIMLNSGNHRPNHIEFNQWNEEVKRWITVGIYYPKFCPECGRELSVYRIDERGTSFQDPVSFIPRPDGFIAVDSEGNEIDYAIFDGDTVVEKDKHEFITELKHETGCSYLLCMDAYGYMKRRNGTKALAIAYLKVKQLGPNSKKTFDERVIDYLKDMQVQGK